MKIIFHTGSFFKRNILVLRSFIGHINKMSIHESTVFVKQFEKEDTMKITFVYKYPDFPAQNFTFLRSKTELLEAALGRIKSKMQFAILRKTLKKRKKRATLDVNEELPPLNIVLLQNGMTVDERVTNIQAWTSDTEVVINEISYKVSVNPPTIIHISLPKCILSRFPVYPRLNLDFCSRNDCLYNWYRNISKNSDVNKSNESEFEDKNKNWTLISQGFVYDPQKSDVGHQLRISCIPRYRDKSGMEECAVSVNDVSLGPEICPFEDRHHFTKEITQSGSLRFVSYNILADLYADTDTARNELFPYCPAAVLALDYRKSLYLKEIAGYNADIVCLQEVDRGVFNDDLVPFLSTVGLTGVFNAKGGQVAEGLACFYRDSKFKLIESHSIILSDAIKTEPVLQDLYSKILENEKLAERFLSRTTALQVALLESLQVPKKRLLVGNTHLYFHPNSDNIRLLQAACCFLYLENYLQKYQEDATSYTTSLIVGGDFNSCPEFGVYKLATEGFLPSTCIDWKSNAEESVEGMNLAHSLVLSSACGTPQYTNFTQAFDGCLDYIFYDASVLDVTEVVPFPSHEQVTEHIALPNKVFPSDHIALVSTLRWK